MNATHSKVARAQLKAQSSYYSGKEQRASQLNARELYDAIQWSSSSKLMVEMIASAQQRADDAQANKR